MSMEFFTSTNVSKAKKQYVCECCNGTIAVGDPYVRESGKYDGEMFDRKLHTICAAMEREYCADVDCEFTWDAVQDHICDKYCYDCKRSARFDDEEDWEECDTTIFSCEKIRQELLAEGSVQ